MSTTIGFFKTLRTDGSATSSKKLWLDNQKKMILGSHSSCDIRLRIHGASDNQASFELDMASGNIYVIHNGKPNTTFLGNRVLQAGERTLVKDGDVISYKDGITCRSFRFEYNPQKKKNKMNRHENSENENPNSLKLRRRSMPTALGTSSTKVPQRMPLMARDCKTVQKPNTSKAIHDLQEAKRVVFDSRHSSKSNSNGSSNHVEKEDCKQKTISNESSCVPSSPLAEETTIKEVVEILHDTVDADDAVLDKILSEDCSDLDISVSSATSKDDQLDTIINENDVDETLKDDKSTAYTTNSIPSMAENLVEDATLLGIKQHTAAKQDTQEHIAAKQEPKIKTHRNDEALKDDKSTACTTNPNPSMAEKLVEDVTVLGTKQHTAAKQDTQQHIAAKQESILKVYRTNRRHAHPQQRYSLLGLKKEKRNKYHDISLGIRQMHKNQMKSEGTQKKVKVQKKVIQAKTLRRYGNVNNLSKMNTITQGIEEINRTLDHNSNRFEDDFQHNGIFKCEENKNRLKEQNRNTTRNQIFENKKEPKTMPEAKKECLAPGSHEATTIEREAEEEREILCVAKKERLAAEEAARIEREAEEERERLRKAEEERLAAEEAARIEREAEEERERLRKAEEERLAAEEAARIEREAEEERHRLRKAEEERLAAEDAARIEREAEEERERLRKAEEERLAAEEAARIEREAEEERERLRKAEEERLAAEEAARIEREAEEERERLRNAEEERLAAEEAARTISHLQEDEEEMEPEDNIESVRQFTVDELSTFKVAELREMCSNNDLPTKGLKKAQLVSLLETFYQGRCHNQERDDSNNIQQDLLSNCNVPNFAGMNVNELRFFCEEKGFSWKGLSKSALIHQLESKREQVNPMAVVSLADNNYSTMKVSELKEECFNRSIDTKGMKKADLIDALKKHDLQDISQKSMSDDLVPRECFSDMKVVQLRAACKARGLSTAGTKASLIERLELYVSSEGTS